MPAHRISVLVADDVKSFHDLLKLGLESRTITIGDVDISFDVDVAHNGHDAALKFDLVPFHLVISDWEMPLMTGIELLRTIRNRTDGLRDVPFILMSSGHMDDEEIVWDAGGDAFIAKPFSISEILLLIERMLRKKWSFIQNSIEGGRA